MPKVKVRLTQSSCLGADSIIDLFEAKEISIQYFFDLHEKFIVDKRLEGLSQRTIQDHLSHIHFLKKFIYVQENIDAEHRVRKANETNSNLHLCIHYNKYNIQGYGD